MIRNPEDQRDDARSGLSMQGGVDTGHADPLELSKGAGVFLGEGVPAKLAAKITGWEYLDMTELLPEMWALPSEV